MKKVVRSSGRAVIYCVFLRCLAESQAGQVLSNIENAYQRTANMTGKSVNTVRKNVKEGEKNNGIISTPGKHRKGRPKKDLDDFDLFAIRQKVYFFYTVKNQVAAEQAFSNITAEDWNKSCKHVMKIEKEYYDRGLTNEQIEKLVINLRDDSSSDLSELEYFSDSEVAGSSQNVSLSGIEYLDESVFDSSV